MAELNAKTWRFDKPRHIKYWKRCLKTLLPSQYTSNDSNRMYLAYFILSALEALDIVSDSMSQDERKGYIDWIYHCQHHSGGFRMWPGTDFGHLANDSNAKWDPAHVPATYFALVSLLILGDDLAKVNTTGALIWLRRLQRSDGSFGETLVNGQIEGGNDPRFGYCAAGIRYILRRVAQRLAVDVADIDIAGLAASIQRGQSFDGGIADMAYHEPHAGYTFCALGALALTDQLHDSNVVNISAVISWLVDRQTDLVDPDSVLDSEFVGQQPATTVVKPEDDRANLDGIPAAGMNGRTNKTADTCYCWWVGASLTMLNQAHLFNQPAQRRYLLQLTQHPFMGGFSKFPDDRYADIYHSCMGLLALSMSSTAQERSQDGIKQWDAEMCVSKDIRQRIDEYPR